MHRSKESIKQLEVSPLCNGVVLVKRELGKKVFHWRSQWHNRIERRRAIAMDPRRCDAWLRFIESNQQRRLSGLGDAIRRCVVPVGHLGGDNSSKVGIIDVSERIFLACARNLTFQPVPVGPLQHGTRADERSGEISRQSGGVLRHRILFGGPHPQGQHIGDRARALFIDGCRRIIIRRAMKLLSRLASLIAASLMLWLAPSACARDSVDTAPPEQAAPLAQPARPALWKVADEDTTIWLFGTVHVLPPGIDWLNGPVASALDDSDELVTEIVEPGSGAMQEIVRRFATLPQGQSLRDLMPPEERTKYEVALDAMKVPVSIFDRYDIWYAAVGLSTLPLLQEGYATSNGVDAKLAAIAKERGAKHEGLETPEFQIGLFDALPLAVQQRYLSEVLDQLPTIRTDLKAMVEAWKTGDADTLAKLMNEGESEPELMEVLLTNRNRTWAKWIAKRLDEPGEVFVAVGAGHLAGPDSVQAQLTAAKIEAMRVQ